jgi:hypothetical protein
MRMAETDRGRPARRDDGAIAAEVRAVREEYAEEEAEAAEIEAAENAAALEVSLSLRITRELDDALSGARPRSRFLRRRWFVGCFGRPYGAVMNRF